MLRRGKLTFSRSGVLLMSNGGWYFISYQHTITSYYEANSVETISEVVFIPKGGSVAKHILKHCDEFGDSWEERGMTQSQWTDVLELSLLLPDGQKITGFKPKSIAHLFVEPD